jgi:hypothetical protein
MGSLIEMAIVLAAMAILTVVGIREDVAKKRTELLTSEGQNEAVIASAFGGWIDDNYATLLSDYTSGGNAAMVAPTIAELYTAGELKQPHSAGPFWGGAYMLSMSMTPAGCSASAGDCHVSFAMWPSLPLRRGSLYDVDGASQIAQAANQAGGAQFGYSKNTTPSTILGINGAFNATNPLGNVPAVVMATNGPGTDGNSLYIRRDGSLTWTGDQNVNGVSLHNVNSIDATGTIAAPTLAASNVDVTDAIRTPGTLAVQNAAGTAPAPISTGAATVNGNANVSGMLTLGNIAVPRASCSGPAVAGAADGSGMMFACQRDPVSGMQEWLPIGGAWQQYGRYVVANTSVVPAPSCNAGGTPEILLNPQNFYIDPTASLNFDASGAGPWTIAITDGNGTPIGNTAVATTYCAY